MSLLKEDVEVLREVPIFASVDPSKLKLLAFASQRLKFDDGQVLCVEGELGDRAFVIVKGTADVFVRAGDTDVKVATVGRNDFIGDMAILCDRPRSATVKASSALRDAGHRQDPADGAPEELSRHGHRNDASPGLPPGAHQQGLAQAELDRVHAH